MEAVAGCLELSEEDFEKFSRLISQSAGINLHKGKQELLRARLAKRIREKGLSSFGEYYQCVISDPSGEELRKLLDSITTNLTYFFREEAHFLYLKECIFPALKESIRRKERAPCVYIWSAGCSTGEEPYSLGIQALESLGDFRGIHIEILGTDISSKALHRAAAGIYPMANVEHLPSSLIRKYFLKGHGPRNGYVKVKAFLRNIVRFERHNLKDKPPATAKMDIVFCRNVMIYFDKETQSRVVQNLASALRPGGVLFVGHAESLCGLRTGLRYLRPAVYQKP